MPSFKKFGVKTSIPRRIVWLETSLFLPSFLGSQKSLREHERFHGDFFRVFWFAFFEGFSTFHSEASPTLVALGYDRRPPGASPRVRPVWLRRFRAGGSFFCTKISGEFWFLETFFLWSCFVSVKSLGVLWAESPNFSPNSLKITAVLLFW